MSDPHDHLPDPAALDELQRAFGEREAEPVTSEDGVDDAENAGLDGVEEVDELAAETGEPAEILIVEQEPLVESTPTPPSIIRIDDYAGSSVIERPVSAVDGGTAGTGRAGGEGDRDAERAGKVDDRDVDQGADGSAVITIADEGVPDAHYIEGSLDGSAERSIVFIDDDDTGDTVAPEIDREVRRGIEPRLRERRAAVKRALGRKRLRWLLFGFFVFVVGVAVLAVLGSGLFAIKEENVTVVGAVYADSAQVDAVVDDLVGTPALRADTQAAEEALEAIPWVDEARVRVSFPNSATIEIREREAWSTYQGPDQRYRVLDRDGRVLAVLDGYPIAYVLLGGPDPVDLEPGDFAPQGYAAASELAKNLTTSIRGQVARIDVTSDGSSLSLQLDDGTEVRFGAARDLFNKLLRLETTLANNPEREPGVIDVSTSEVTL